jgi:hypothetical protein
MRVLPVLPELPEPVDGSLSMAACRGEMDEPIRKKIKSKL